MAGPDDDDTTRRKQRLQEILKTIVDANRMARQLRLSPEQQAFLKKIQTEFDAELLRQGLGGEAWEIWQAIHRQVEAAAEGQVAPAPTVPAVTPPKPDAPPPEPEPTARRTRRQPQRRSQQVERSCRVLPKAFPPDGIPPEDMPMPTVRKRVIKELEAEKKAGLAPKDESHLKDPSRQRIEEAIKRFKQKRAEKGRPSVEK
jgi:hypothetical protein